MQGPNCLMLVALGAAAPAGGQGRIKGTQDPLGNYFHEGKNQNKRYLNNSNVIKDNSLKDIIPPMNLGRGILSTLRDFNQLLISV